MLVEVYISDSLWQCRFCSNPFELEVICEIVKKIEDELYDVLEMNPTVKALEAFVRKNSKDLHTKHYLNLIGMINRPGNISEKCSCQSTLMFLEFT